MTDATLTGAALVRAALDRHAFTRAALAAALEPPATVGAVDHWLAGRRAPSPAYALQLRRLAGIADDHAIPQRAEAIAGWAAAVALAEETLRAGPDAPGHALAREIARVGRATLRAAYGVELE